MTFSAWALLIGICIALALVIKAWIESRKKSSSYDKQAYFILIMGVLFITYLVTFKDSLEPVDWIQIWLTAGLIAVTVVYALLTSQIAKSTKEQAEATAKQADANVIMAEEMKEQRISSLRPVIIQKATHEQDLIEGNPSDHYLYFEIYNAGNSPAIELEILRCTPF